MVRELESAVELTYFIDCGAHCGESILYAKKLFGTDITVISFEGIPYLADKLTELYADDDSVMIQNSLVWIESGTNKLYLSTEWSDGSSMYAEKTSGGVSEDLYVEVPTFDLSTWITTTFSKDDYIILKLDVEGAEYDILEKMIKDGTLDHIDILCGEFHDMKIDNDTVKEKAKFVYKYLSDNNIDFKIWETPTMNYIDGKLVERPTNMEDIV